MTEALRDALGQIAGKNDLSGVSDDDLESAACNALHECELIARAALAATPAVPSRMDAIDRRADEIDAAIKDGRPPAVGGERKALELIKRLVDNEIMTDEEIIGDIRVEVYEALAAQPASPLRGREALADLVDAVECELDIEYRSFAFCKRFFAAKAALSASPPAQPAAAPDVRAIDRRCDQIDRRMEKHQHIASDKKALDGETGA